MNRYVSISTRALLLGGALLSTGCMSSQDQRAEVDRVPVPTAINSDAQRRAAYDNGTNAGGAVPDATPGQVPIREQASGTGARQRIESVNTNDPNTTTPETRVRRLRDSPVDTLRRP
ncbi:hypothetical protein LJY25_16245 [Hymenobacter sp. BT175]|uniref:hypothetical protein n=1 Tax=Hymenobacter translucens TaxID=2886507 RepID=UPI001D0E03D5|nr:hypothetical protein [Hymenobacter translucens]MCC2548000.1 hypothetical protein [Hymenobacter translucens]